MDICDTKGDLLKSADSLDVNGWVNFAAIFSVHSQSAYEAACKYVDNHLYFQLYLLGNTPSPADDALVSALDSSGERWRSLRDSDKYKNLSGLHSVISSRRNGDLKPKITYPTIDLPGAKSGEVCMRFKIEPSQCLHIEHARMAFWNHYFTKRYDGKFIAWIDDTNPNNKDHPFVPNLLEDIECLDIKCDAVVYTSQYFSQMIQMAQDLINKGKAYVDYSSRKQIEEGVKGCIESKYRNHSLEKNKELWREMVTGSDIGRDCFLRGKMDMHHQNKCFRDPVYYCCNPDTPHQRTGTQYKVYPTPIFASSFVDGCETVTHVLQSSHNQARVYPVYCRVREDMGLHTAVQTHECKPMGMECTLRKEQELSWFVENGEVDGWDDPRLPTMRGLLRRGVQIEALKQFFLEKGLEKNPDLVEWESLWRINHKVIFERPIGVHTAILQNKCVPFVLENAPRKLTSITVPVTDRLTTVVTESDIIWLENVEVASVSVGDRLTLAFWNDAEVTNISVNESGIITALKGFLTSDRSKTTTPNLWLTPKDDLVKLRLLEFDHLITKKKLIAGEDFLGVINSSTQKETLAFGDSMMRNLKRGDTVLLAWRGYFRCDVPFTQLSEPVVLISIPGTHDGIKRPDPNIPVLHTSS
ncbi:glutamate--tRNA ligase [Ranunculus cassubicifolius]